MAAAASTTPRTVVEVIRVEQAPSADRRFGWVLIAAVLMVFAIVGAVVFTYKPAKEPDAVILPRHTHAPDEPSATATVTETAAPTAPDPTEITVEISAEPQKASIFIDGAKTPTNPHRVNVVAGRFQHELRVEADGYVTQTRTVAFDRERTIEFVLVKSPLVPVAPVVRPGGGGAPTPTPTPSATQSAPAPSPTPDVLPLK